MYSLSKSDARATITAMSELDTLETRTNACAIIALLTALLGLFLPGMVFGIIGMIQCSRRVEDGWGMAFAAVIIGILVLLGTLFWIAFVFAS